MQSLYEYLQREGDLLKITERNTSKHDFEENNTKFIKKVAKGVKKYLAEIDKIISISAPEWPITQIAQVDLSILRLAIFELIFDDEVPPKAVINEAVELSKAFGGENTSKFVNGVLGTVYRSSEKYQEEESSASTAKSTTKKETTKSPKKDADKNSKGKKKTKKWWVWDEFTNKARRQAAN